MEAIRMNQMGYAPNSHKKIVYVGNTDTFRIYGLENNQLAYTGKLINYRYDEASGEYVCTGDFSELNKPGIYFIEIEDEKSLLFTISDEQPVICTDALLKAFYYQRCGMELKEEYAGKWKHSACHLQPSYIFRQDAEIILKRNQLQQEELTGELSCHELEQLDTSGGWHDAGDYGRYTIAMAKTIADLLLAYEHFEETFDHSIHIPESEKKGADILHEVKYGLDFLFKMQRPNDGAVYTKVATRYFPGMMIMPERDMEPIFIFDISSPATAGFTAVMAMAAKIFKKFDSEYAQRCLKAAEKSYHWLWHNQEPLFFRNPPNINSGQYGDDIDLDERYWASAQMYQTTGEEKYHDDFLQLYFMLKDKLSLEWRSVGGYGTIAYLTCGYAINKEVYDALKKEWLMNAEDLEKRSKENGYGITLAMNEYIWGSLMILLNQSIQLIIANRLRKDSLYDEVIQNNWDYLFGMNPMDISYVTGLGGRAVMAPHHRPSEADGVKEPVPGLLAGGPCASLRDEITRKYCQGMPPAKCYVDHVDSYSTNEIDTYWNSPAVYVGAYLSSK